MLISKILTALGFGEEEGGGDAAVKRQAEGFSNPMYQLANLFGQVGQSKGLVKPLYQARVSSPVLLCLHPVQFQQKT